MSYNISYKKRMFGGWLVATIKIAANKIEDAVAEFKSLYPTSIVTDICQGK